MLGIRGKRLKLLRNPPPGSGGRGTLPKARWWSLGDFLRAVRRRELGQQDKAIGIAELADAVRTGRPSFPPHDFTLHLTELTIGIQNAGAYGGSIRLKTSFAPIEPRPETLASTLDYSAAGELSPIGWAIERWLLRINQH